MTLEELDILLQEDVLRAIEQNIECDALKVALNSRLPHPREVATQVKYLQRARHKLPRLYEARGIIPQRAFEQSSSEECAALKHIGGTTLLDLTCGLGIDSAALASRFQRVVALERDEVLAAVTRENMRRMGIENVDVVCCAAEEYIATCGERFDWVYADPDRRGERGQKLVRLEDCSPNIIELLPDIWRITDHLAIKNSPIFDIDEAFRLFPHAEVEVVSLAGECKEVMIYTPSPNVAACEPRVVAEAVGRGRFEALRSEVENTPTQHDFMPDAYRYLVIPDVALQKARMVIHALRGKADVWSNNSFGFAAEMPADVLGRVVEIERVEPFDMKALRRELRGKGVDIMLRDFPTGVDELRKRCSMHGGNEKRIALTRIQGKSYTIYLK
ncbi:MAG: methyltransferase domain-containing protein [Alistipes sp.]|nr:methyltransferase domain-containing protein [Alistipes sp.]